MAQAKTLQDAKELDILHEMVKNKNLRLTDARKHIYLVLQRSEYALTAKDIFRGLEEVGLKTDLASVYRNITTFEEIGLIHKLSDGRYRLCDFDHDHHDHVHVIFCCDKCGLTEELPHAEAGMCKSIDAILANSEQAKESRQFVINGICKRC